MTCIDTQIIYYYIVITYILGLVLHFFKYQRRQHTDAHDLLNLLISPVYMIVLIVSGIAFKLFPDKFK